MFLIFIPTFFFCASRLHPTIYRQDVCSIVPGFSCVDYGVTARGNGKIEISLQQEFGETLSDIQLSLNNSFPNCDGTFLPQGITLKHGEHTVFTLVCKQLKTEKKFKGVDICSIGEKRNRFHGNLEISYKTIGKEAYHKTGLIAMGY